MIKYRKNINLVSNINNYFMILFNEFLNPDIFFTHMSVVVMNDFISITNLLCKEFFNNSRISTISIQ